MGFINFASSNVSARNFSTTFTGQVNALSMSCISGIYTYFFGSNRMYRFNANNALTTTSAVSGAPQGCCEGTGGRVVLFVQNQGFYTSDNNGVSWTLRQAAAATSISGMAHNGSGRIVAQVSLSSTSWVSDDNGTTWSSNTNLSSANNNAALQKSLRYFPSIGRFIRVGLAGAIATTVDGVTWTPINTGAANTILSVEFFNNTFYFGTSGGQIWRSTDNLATFANLDPSNLPYNTNSGSTIPAFGLMEVFNNALYVASSAELMYSTDGTKFFPVTIPASVTMQTCNVNNNTLYFNNGSNILRSLVN